MEVVVARIGRPHGIHGEVSVEVRTDDPEGRLAPGTTVRTDPAAAGPLTITDGRVHSGRLLLHFEGYDDRGGRRGAAQRAARRRRRPGRAARGPRRVLRPPAGRAGRAHRGRRAGRRARRGAAPARARTCSSSAGPTAPRCWCRSSPAIVPSVDLDAGRGRGRPAARPAPDVPDDDTERASDVRVDVVTIFPEYLAPLRLSLIGRAVEDGLLDLRVHDLRDWTSDRHRTVDDTPYGGGPGMLMRPEPWGEALDAVLGEPAAEQPSPRLLVPDAGRYAVHPGAGARARGRAVAGLRLRPLRGHRRAGARRGRRAAAGSPRSRLGDYVLNGGEVAVLAIVEAVARLLPGVIGNAESLVEESHADGLLEAPGYTKPADLARPRGAARCCCPATTPGSPAGGGTRRCGAPPTAGRTCWTRSTRPRWTAHDLAAAGRAGLGTRPTVDWPASPALWQTEPLRSRRERPRHREGAARTTDDRPHNSTPHRG